MTQAQVSFYIYIALKPQTIYYYKAMKQQEVEGKLQPLATVRDNACMRAGACTVRENVSVLQNVYMVRENVCARS